MKARKVHFEEYVKNLTSFTESDAWGEQLAKIHTEDDTVWGLFSLAVENQDLLMDKELEALSGDGLIDVPGLQEIRAALAVSVAALVELDRILEQAENEAHERIQNEGS